MLDDALAYAKRGWAVLALSPNSKIPVKDKDLQPNGSLSASVNPEHITALWKLYPKANVGIATGEVSNLTVVDFDTKDPKTLCAENGLTPPKSYMVQTPNGWHLYLPYDPEIAQTAGRIEKLDTRNNGGYVVAPPSVVNEKPYRVINDAPLKPWPQLREKLAKRTEKSRGAWDEGHPSWVSELLVSGATEGRRNDAAIRLAGYFRSMDLPQDIAFASMKQFADQCKPPLDYSELESVVQSAYRYTPAKRIYTGTIDPEPQIDETISGKLRFMWPEQGIFISADRIKERTDGVTCWLTITQSSMGDIYGPVLVNVLQPTFDERQPKKLRERYEANWDSIFQHVRAKVVSSLDSVAEMVDMGNYEQSSPSPWAIYPFVRKLQPNLVFGDGGNGKTTLGVALAISLAIGKSIVPHAEVKEQGNTLYLDWETDADEFASVRDALLKGSGESIPKDRLKYRRMYGPIEATVDRLARDVVEYEIKNIVVDSLVKAIGDDVNGAEAARVFFQCIGSLEASALIFTHISNDSVRRSGADIRPYGSVFWWDYCRNNWFIKKSSEAESAMKVGLYHSKLNRGKLLKPLGMEMSFEANEEVTTSIRYSVTDVLDDLDLAQGATKTDRVRHMLSRGPMTPAAIAEEMDDDPVKIAALLRKYKGRLFTPLTGNQWANLTMREDTRTGSRTSSRTIPPLKGEGDIVRPPEQEEENHETGGVTHEWWNQ